MAASRKEIQINLRVPPDLAEQIDREAEKTRTNRSWVIREALHRYFNSKSSEKKKSDD